MKKEQRQVSLKDGFKMAEETAADMAVARFFYANGLNFVAADSRVDSYYREMCRAIRDAPDCWTPPTRQTLAGPLLTRCHEQMADDVERRDQEGDLSRKFGVTYTSDGWDSCDNLPLINSAFILANDGGVYQRRTTLGRSKT